MASIVGMLATRYGQGLPDIILRHRDDQPPGGLTGRGPARVGKILLPLGATC